VRGGQHHARELLPLDMIRRPSPIYCAYGADAPPECDL
jgi:hypothetical protein